MTINYAMQKSDELCNCGANRDGVTVWRDMHDDACEYAKWYDEEKRNEQDKTS